MNRRLKWLLPVNADHSLIDHCSAHQRMAALRRPAGAMSFSDSSSTVIPPLRPCHGCSGA